LTALPSSETHLLAPILRIAIGALFVLAGLAKIADPIGFLAAIIAYRLPLSVTSVKLAAVILPWLEVVTGLTLASGIWLDAGLIAASALSILFLAVASQAAIRGLSIQCGCFGSLSERMPSFMNSLPFVLARDFALAAATVALAWNYLRQRGISTPERD
jgi:uncharacterized membrane protein YphA (DoxX/SURF4 family)